MMESIFSFLSSYFSLIFLAKGKNSKSISLLLSHIGPKRSCQSDCRISIWNISLEQSGNSLFFACWYQNLRPDRKILGWTFFSIKVFFHRHWQVAGQMGKGREHLLFHPTTSTCSRTLRHLFATLYMRWLSCIFNCNTCVYQTATQWDLPPYQITIWLIDWWCNACFFTWWTDSRFLLQWFDMGNRWIDHIVMFPLYLIYSNTNFLSSQEYCRLSWRKPQWQSERILLTHWDILT